MDKIYQEAVKENNNIQNQLTGEYQTFSTELLKELRKYALKTKQTENNIKLLLHELVDAQTEGVRFTTFVTNKQTYLLEKQKLFTKRNAKPKFSRKEIIGITIFLLIMVFLAVYEIVLKQPVKFDVPDNVKIENNVLYFNKVEYAQKYRIICTDVQDKTIFEKIITSLDDGKTYIEVNLTTYNELNTPGTYKIKVRTMENQIFSSSKWSKEVVFIFNNS